MPDDTGVTTPPTTRHGNRGAGRKTLLTPEIQKKIIEAIELGDSDINACAYAGVSQTAFYSWIQKGTDQPATENSPARPARSPYREFAAELTRARAVFRVNHLRCIARAAQGTKATPGDWRASKFMLAVKWPDEFSERQVLEQRHTNATGQGPVVVATGGDLATAIAELAKLPEEVRDALAGVGGGLAPDDDG